MIDNRKVGVTTHLCWSFQFYFNMENFDFVTRKKALSWWNRISQEKRSQLSLKHNMLKETGFQIEEILRKELKELHSMNWFMKK